MFNGERLRQFRLARGMSLNALASASGGVVTKQSLSKYERGISLPSQEILQKLANSLGVSTDSLCLGPLLPIEIIDYRKSSRLTKREQNRIENLVQYIIEKRTSLLDMLGDFGRVNIPEIRFPVNSAEKAEIAAEKLRVCWGLGKDPIHNMVSLLENNRFHVIEVDAAESFDGLSLRVRNNEGKPVSAGVVTSRGIPGERQRLNLAHELGHVVLDIDPDVDREKAAFRFGAAFLAPAQTLIRDVGRHRKFISAHELVLLKRRYRMSIQAILFRLRELGIINAHVYTKWCIMIGKMGWRKQEPQSLDPERPEWLHRLVHRAFSNGLLSKSDAYQLLRLGQDDWTDITLVESREFTSMSGMDIRKLLEKQVGEI